jgi:hypothetical protein
LDIKKIAVSLQSLNDYSLFKLNKMKKQKLIIGYYISGMHTENGTQYGIALSEGNLLKAVKIAVELADCDGHFFPAQHFKPINEKDFSELKYEKIDVF